MEILIEKNLGGKIEVVSVAQYFAKAIDRINNKDVFLLFMRNFLENFA